MKLVGRVPVEPLSDERITNIERAIVAGAADAAAKGRARESRWPVFGFAMATIVLVIGAGFVGWKLRGGGETIVTEAGPLDVKTGASGTTIDIGDAKITSDPATRFVVARAGTGVTITMTRGKVALDVAKRTGKEPLIVRAGDTDVEVVGTQFSVDYGDGTGEVDVRVTEGKVKVTRRTQAHEPTLVAGGEAWETRRGKIALADATTKVAVAGRTPDHEIEMPVEPPKDVGKEAGKEVGLHDRTAIVPDARIPTTGAGSGSGRTVAIQGGPENVRPQATDKANIDFLNAIVRQPVEPALEVNLDPDKAVAKYREMTARGAPGKEASKAFYSIAVVQHLKLGRESDAIQTLEQYFRRFRPDAPEYVAARWLDVRVKCTARTTNGRFKLAITDRCRQAAYTYAHVAPASPQRTVAESLSTARGD